MRQELLQRSFDHVMKQGKPSINHNGGVCRYRSADGLSCAAAIFITEYNEDVEGLAWHTLAEIYNYRMEPIAVEESIFVTKVLQRAHDVAAEQYNASNPFLTVYKEELRKWVKVWNHEKNDNIQLPEGF